MHLENGSTHTVGYSAPNPPSEREIPSHIVLVTQVVRKMRGCLRKYLTTKLGPQHVPVPEVLASTLNTTRERLAVNLPNLTNETTANFFFAGNHVVPLVTDFVFNMDGVPVQLEEAPMTHGAKPDGIWGCGVHVEFLSPRALLNHVPEIFALGRANGNGKGSALVLRE